MWVFLILSIKVIGEPHRPASLQPFPGESFKSSPHLHIALQMISTHSRHFRQSIMARTKDLRSMKFADNNANSGNITDSFNTNINHSDQDARITSWLSPLEPDGRHHKVRTNRYDGVRGWVLETREFYEWTGGDDGADKAVLFCSGNPGVGKTYLRLVATFIWRANITDC